MLIQRLADIVLRTARFATNRQPGTSSALATAFRWPTRCALRPHRPRGAGRGARRRAHRGRGPAERLGGDHTRTPRQLLVVLAVGTSRPVEEVVEAGRGLVALHETGHEGQGGVVAVDATALAQHAAVGLVAVDRAASHLHGAVA